MKAVNIFEVIGETTRRIEPFHSEFLAEALRVSAKGNRSLFDAVWKLAAPEGWDIPVEPKIESEERMDDGKRIDICIFDKSRDRLLGIEVKTTKASAKEGQLEDYLQGLCQKYGHNRNDKDRVAIAYLTPFNYKRAGNAANALPTVRIFKEFSSNFRNASHMSWLDIADIPWDGNELWRQHQAYVHQEIANYGRLQSFVSRNRAFDDFFSEMVVEDFWATLPVEVDRNSDAGVTIDLATFGSDPTKLIRALEILIKDRENVSENASIKDKFSGDSRQKFLKSKHEDIHAALFDLSRHSHVWVEGTKDYGLRVAHKRHSSGVSLVRSKGEQYLVIGQSR